MSVGAVDPTQPPIFDPNAQDPAKVQAMLAAPLPPAAIPDAAPPPSVPTPAPGPTDVPQPSAAFTPPDSSAIAKSMTAPAIASALPGAPPPIPGAPSTPAATPDAPTTPSQTDDLKKAQDEEAKAREASDKAQLDLQKSQQPSVEEKNQLLQQQVEHLKASQVEQQKQRDQFETAQLAANDQLKQTQDLIKKFKYRDYFSNEDGSTKWGLKIGSALAAGLGAYGAGLTHGPNYALQILNKNMDDWHASQLDHLNQLKDEEVMQRTGIQDAQLARQKAQSDLTLKDAGFDKLIASQLDAAAARQSSTSFAPSLTAAAAKLKLDAAEKETAAKKLAVELNLKLGDEQRKARGEESTINKNNAEAGLANARAGHIKTGATGGAGNGKAYDAFHTAVLNDDPNVGELAAKAGIKPAQISEQITKIRTENRKENPGEAVDPKLIVRMADGTEAGTASSARAVPQLQKELRAQARAIEQLKELRNTKWVSTRDPRFHNAVLAVASTTSAGSTDANVAHEKGTLTDALGLPDNDAIDRKIAEIENLNATTKAQLTPLPDNYVSKKPSAPAAAAEGKPAAAKVTALKLKDGTIAHFDASGKRID